MPALAQAPQEMGCPRASDARLTAKGLAAIAVMNMAEEIVLVWKQVFMTYEPIFLSVPLAGSLPQARHRALAKGKKMPPAGSASTLHHLHVRRARSVAGKHHASFWML